MESKFQRSPDNQMMLEGLEIFKTNKTCNLKTSLLYPQCHTQTTRNVQRMPHGSLTSKLSRTPKEPRGGVALRGR